MAGRYWIWTAALVAPAALMLGWAMLPSGNRAGEPGVVRIAEGAASPPVAAKVALASTEAASTPVTPQRNAELADEDHYLVLREVRDRAWADRSEAALQALLRSLAYLDRNSLAARCTASVCEVSGIAIEDPASGSMVPIWAALDRDSAGATLGRQGLERAATTFGTGRVREEFVIHYRRADAPKQP